MNYQIGDFVIRVKNAALAKRKEVVLPYSKVNKEIGKVLVKEGFLEDIKENSVDGHKTLAAIVRYENRMPVLNDIEIISKPSLRVYESAKDLMAVERRGRRRVIVSTNKGILTGKDARKKGLGGEVLFAIW